MPRAIPGGPLWLAALLLAVPPAAAAPPLPAVRTIPQDLIDVARLEAERAPAPPCATDPRSEPSFEERHAAGPRTLNLDDDAAHYCRGNILVVHIFIDHDGGTWSLAEKTQAGARAEIGKYFFTAAAPQEANVSFDGGVLGVYHEFTATLGVTIDEMSWPLTEAALADVGFTDDDGDGVIVDDASLSLQTFAGGFDQVILCFEPADLTGRAFASYQYSRTCLYTDDSGAVFAHEWGHLFGSCDEYVEDGTCGGGQDCGPCQSEYLNQAYDNSNCQLSSCPLDEECLMIDNSFNACLVTLGHWAWLDANANGQLDNVRRRVFLAVFADVWELWDGGIYKSNSNNAGLVYHQTARSWSVVGVRSAAAGNQDLHLYGDDNHEHLYASSTMGPGVVDFVVADYNFNNRGNEHVQVGSPIPGVGEFTVQWESGESLLYADGLARAGTWGPDDVVRVWDVPLWAGQGVDFKVSVTSGNLDVGMALFQGNAGDYFAPRANALWWRDANGPGGTENRLFQVTQTGVYGLVVWTNQAGAGGFEIQLGPTQTTLAEETVETKDSPLGLYRHFPTTLNSWQVVAARPWPGSNLSLGIWDDENYTIPKDSSSTQSGVEVVALDYNHVAFDRLYDRVVRFSGAGAHSTNWEHDQDFINGAESGTWPAGLVAKVWDAWMEKDQEYMLRGYHGSLDSGLMLFASGDGDYVRDASEAAVISNSNPVPDGEWFTWISPVDDWVGLVQIANTSGGGAYQNWWGPRVWLADDAKQGRTDEVVWGRQIVPPGYWNVWGVRPNHAGGSNVSLYADEACTSTQLKATDQTGTGVNYVVGDFHHSPAGTYWQRMWFDGEGRLDFESEGAAEQLSPSPGTVLEHTAAWPAGDVVEVFDVFLRDAREAGSVHVLVEDLAGTLDLGIAIFDSRNNPYFANPAQAAEASDAQVVGGSESFVFAPPRDDWYGLVITNRNESGGDYRIKVGPAAAVGAPVAVAGVPDRLELRASPNPFRGAADVTLALPRAGAVDVRVHDVTGRLVRALANGTRAAGWHTVTWDGRDDAGGPAAAGIYFVRAAAGGSTATEKLVRLP